MSAPVSLASRFGVVVMAGLMGGCATVCQTRECLLEQTAHVMLGSEDIGIRATGARTLQRIHPEIAQESAQVRDALVPQRVECVVGAPVIVEGKKVFPCVKPPAAAASAPAP